MKVDILNQGITKLKEQLGPSLLAADIWKSGVGSSLANYNSTPKTAALFDRATEFISKTLDGTGFPELEDYYLLELKDKKLVVVLIFPEGYQWGILADKNNLNMGMLLGIAIPQARKFFYRAYEVED